mmetsp:Transcript_37636/g.49588  ORF Transcript_37636/g.49588 Transcript_37636/m.49588 type:complete len:95 (-) Transcript_37636:1835-2119(-)
MKLKSEVVPPAFIYRLRQCCPCSSIVSPEKIFMEGRNIYFSLFYPRYDLYGGRMVYTSAILPLQQVYLNLVDNEGSHNSKESKILSKVMVLHMV